MSSRYPLFDRNLLTLLPLSERQHELDVGIIRPLRNVDVVQTDFFKIATKIRQAKIAGASVILMMGAHVLRSGVQKYLIDLIEKKLISCIAVNGACAIHDYELARFGATTENVDRYISSGQFGLWKETGDLNQIAIQAAETDRGLGECVGKVIEESNFEFKNISLFATAYRERVPITVHCGIGYDIIHEHPDCDGSAYGKTSYTDFLIFTEVMRHLSNGVVMNFGSAVMAPEIFLKSLAMVRNVAIAEEESVDNFATLVCDLKKIPKQYRKEPVKTEPDYYFRPWKTMLVRTQSTRAESYYIQADHRITIPSLWTAVQKEFLK